MLFWTVYTRVEQLLTRLDMSTSKGEEQKGPVGPVPEMQAYLQEQTALSRKIRNAFAKLERKGRDQISLTVLRGRVERLET